MSFRFVGSVGNIIVKCKDLRVIQLDIPGMDECLNIASSIEVKAPGQGIELLIITFFIGYREILCILTNIVSYVCSLSQGSVHT